jgi:prevent-host-death family protein
MNHWQLNEAEHELERIVDLAIQQEPQTIVRDGREVAVVLSIEEYRRLRASDPTASQPGRPTLKDVLLKYVGADGDFDLQPYIPPRGQYTGRPPLKFED